MNINITYTTYANAEKTVQDPFLQVIVRLSSTESPHLIPLGVPIASIESPLLFHWVPPLLPLEVPFSSTRSPHRFHWMPPSLEGCTRLRQPCVNRDFAAILWARTQGRGDSLSSSGASFPLGVPFTSTGCPHLSIHAASRARECAARRVCKDHRSLNDSSSLPLKVPIRTCPAAVLQENRPNVGVEDVNAPHRQGRSRPEGGRR